MRVRGFVVASFIQKGTMFLSPKLIDSLMLMFLFEFWGIIRILVILSFMISSYNKYVYEHVVKTYNMCRFNRWVWFCQVILGNLRNELRNIRHCLTFEFKKQLAQLFRSAHLNFYNSYMRTCDVCSTITNFLTE